MDSPQRRTETSPVVSGPPKVMFPCPVLRCRAWNTVRVASLDTIAYASCCACGNELMVKPREAVAVLFGGERS